MDYFLPDKCLNTDILLAPDRDTWVECNTLRAQYSSYLMAAVIVIIIMMLYFAGASPWLTGILEGRAWDTLRVEQEPRR